MRDRRALYRHKNAIGHCHGRQVAGDRITVPDDVEWAEFTAPCFLCNAAGEYRHRRAA